MTDLIRAALEAFLRPWGSMSDEYLRSGAAAVEFGVETVGRVIDGRAALRAAPEPERCEYRNKFGDPVCVLPPGHPNGHTSVQPAPAAPTVEALRDALVDDVIDAYQVDAVGRVIYDPPTFRDRLIELEAAARADERTRLSGRHGPRGGSWPGRTW